MCRTHIFSYFLQPGCSRRQVRIGDPFKRGEHLRQKQLRYFFSKASQGIGRDAGKAARPPGELFLAVARPPKYQGVIHTRASS